MRNRGDGMFDARVFFAASVMTLFLYPMTAMAADVLPPGGVADGGELPNVTSTPCTGQPDGYEWTNKKSGRTFVCQNGVSVLKGLNPPKRPCIADVTPNGFSDEHCRGAVTNEDGKMGKGGKGNDKTGSGGDGKGGNGTGKGSGGGTGGGSGGGSGATSGNDTGGSSGSGAGSGSGLSNEAYLAALREWGKRWADYFKSLTKLEQTVQTNLTKKLANCVMIYGASKLGKECSDDAIKVAELERQRIEKLRSDGIARAAKEKAAIDAMKPRPVPAVPMPNGGNGVGGGNGDNINNNNITNNITNNDTTINNNTNITHNGGGSGGGKSGGNGNGGSGQTGNNMGNGSGNDDGKGKGDGLSEYCVKNPDALACISVKNAKFDGENEDVKGGKPSKDFSKFKVTNYFSGGGSCPADVSVNVGIFGSFALSYGWLCRLAAIMRPLVIAFAWLSALFIIVKGSRSE